MLTVETINQNIVKAQYAVRGRIVQEAQELEKQLGKGDHNLPFKKVIYCNIGNPQQLSQKPMTFLRHVQSILTSPDLLDVHEKHKIFMDEEVTRSKHMLKELNVPKTSTGAYTHSQGLEFVRKNVCRFIERRDGLKGVELDPKRVFLTDGASNAVRYILTLILRPNSNDSLMIPIPQYPLYSATIALCGGKQVNYFLREKDNWSLNVEELNELVNTSETNIRALVIINPGNPTGNLLSLENMKSVVEFCVKKNILLLADEVYQENVYNNNKFISFNKVMYDMNMQDKLQLFSFHSTSKGFLGECGRRGGYVHISQAVDEKVLAQLYKLASINLCPNIHGQLSVELMVNPPVEDCKEQYEQERDAIIKSMERRAGIISEQLNKLPGVSCQPIHGAMYAFPKITLPQKAIEKAKEEDMAPDMWYTLQLLRSTGVCCVPGSGFGQEEGTFHFRTTFLPQEEDMKVAAESMSKFQHEFMKSYQ